MGGGSQANGAGDTKQQAGPFAELFCSRPFTFVEVTGWQDPKGDVFVCCPTWLDTPIGNIRAGSLQEIWNGARAQEIRRSILDGTFEYCDASRCGFLQTRRGPVQRREDVDDPRMRGVIQQRLTVLPEGPAEVVCSFDKSCNLSCPTCRTELIVEHGRRDQIEDIRSRLQEEWLEDARWMQITGSGDPFGSPFFREWLHTMRREDLPRLEQLDLISNGLLWTRANWEAIDEDVRLLIKGAAISIDAATPGTYAANRRGGNWDHLLANLELISELRRDGPLRHLTISMVVQDNNFREMPDFVRLGRRFGADVVYFSQLVDWGTFEPAELRRRQVHRRDHACHRDFLDVLDDEVLRDPIAFLGNLTELGSRTVRRTMFGGETTPGE
ncbi:MAG: SPASM domain-containing protein [Acidimicrobiia bacterium]